MEFNFTKVLEIIKTLPSREELSTNKSMDALRNNDDYYKTLEYKKGIMVEILIDMFTRKQCLALDKYNRLDNFLHYSSIPEESLMDIIKITNSSVSELINNTKEVSVGIINYLIKNTPNIRDITNTYGEIDYLYKYINDALWENSTTWEYLVAKSIDELCIKSLPWSYRVLLYSSDIRKRSAYILEDVDATLEALTNAINTVIGNKLFIDTNILSDDIISGTISGLSINVDKFDDKGLRNEMKTTIDNVLHRLIPQMHKNIILSLNNIKDEYVTLDLLLECLYVIRRLIWSSEFNISDDVSE